MTKVLMPVSGGARGIVRAVAGVKGQVPDPESRHGVESQALAEVVDFVQSAAFNPRSGFQGVEETFDPPAESVPAEHGAGILQAGLCLSRSAEAGRGLSPFF